MVTTRTRHQADTVLTRARHRARGLAQTIRKLNSFLGKPTKKENALYYYRQAMKYGDLPAAKRYLQKYYELGSTPTKGLRTSIKMAHPLAGIKKQTGSGRI